LRHRYEEFRAAGAEVAVISFAQRRATEHYARDLRIPFQLLSDPERAAYIAYGLRKGGLWSIFGPKTVWEYVKLIARGRLFRGIQADPFQLGGDFVIDGRGIVRFAHRSEDPADRPTMDRLLQAIRSPAR
jgi:peroxiredoxin